MFLFRKSITLAIYAFVAISLYQCVMDSASDTGNVCDLEGNVEYDGCTIPSSWALPLINQSHRRQSQARFWRCFLRANLQRVGHQCHCLWETVGRRLGLKIQPLNFCCFLLSFGRKHEIDAVNYLPCQSCQIVFRKSNFTVAFWIYECWGVLPARLIQAHFYWYFFDYLSKEKP